MIKRRLKFAIVFILIAGIVPVSCIISACGSRSAKPVTAQTYMLGTIVEISIYDYDGDSREVLEDCIELCGKYEKIFSRTLSSELYNLNIEMAKDGEAEISDELRTIIESSLYYSRLSEGSLTSRLARLRNYGILFRGRAIYLRNQSWKGLLN